MRYSRAIVLSLVTVTRCHSVTRDAIVLLRIVLDDVVARDLAIDRHARPAQLLGRARDIPARLGQRMQQAFAIALGGMQHAIETAAHLLWQVLRSEEHTSELQSPCKLVC